MSRVQLALDVDDLEQAVDFYTRCSASSRPSAAPATPTSPSPTRRSSSCCSRTPAGAGSLNHLGIEVESTESCDAETERLTAAGLITLEEDDTTCCYATQDKVWVTGPGGERWEVYTVKADSETFGVGPADRACLRRHLLLTRERDGLRCRRCRRRPW
jgi:catechol 2,3-dioxygenase-like lactoylglutathione lyase family enzyme